MLILYRSKSKTVNINYREKWVVKCLRSGQVNFINYPKIDSQNSAANLHDINWLKFITLNFNHFQNRSKVEKPRD